MLVLSRKKGESIIIQDQIEITILEVNPDSIKIGIAAPKEVEILRKEIFNQVRETNVESAESVVDMNSLRDKISMLKKRNGEI